MACLAELLNEVHLAVQLQEHLFQLYSYKIYLLEDRDSTVDMEEVVEGTFEDSWDILEEDTEDTVVGHLFLD